MTGALDGIRVIDMSRVIAGPLSGQLLGDLGAEVIKIERPGEGDDIRRVGPPWMLDDKGQETTESTYFQSVNRNKLSMTVDFSKPEGADIIRRLVVEADVFIENFRPGTCAQYGLDYETLKKINPRLIYCSITGFGQTGPYSERSGYDYIMQGMSGIMNVTGHADDEVGAGPLRVGVPVVDALTGMNAALGIVAAIRHRDLTGAGQYVDVALFDSALAVMLNPFSAWFNSGQEIKRNGNQHQSATPHGVFPASDGFVVISTFNSREFARISQALGHPEWIEDPRFAGSEGRSANRKLLIEMVSAATRQKSRAELIQLLNDNKISCGPINAIADLAGDPQVRDRDMIVELRSAEKTVTVCGTPIKLSDSPVTMRRLPPKLGEHTDEILSHVLKMDKASIDALRGERVI